MEREKEKLKEKERGRKKDREQKQGIIQLIITVILLTPTCVSSFIL